MQFSPFFIDCTPTKRSFRRFLPVVPLRKTVFRVFCVSSADDEHFLAISAFRRPTTSVFLHFLALRGVGNTFFGVFHSSEASESHFFSFSTHPRSRKAVFSNFLLIRGLGRLFFSVFASVAYRNLNRFLNPASCFMNDLYTL